MLGFLTMRYRETTGHLPFFKAKKQPLDEYDRDEESKKSSGLFESAGASTGEKAANSSVQKVEPAPRQIEE